MTTETTPNGHPDLAWLLDAFDFIGIPYSTEDTQSLMDRICDRLGQARKTLTPEENLITVTLEQDRDALGPESVVFYFEQGKFTGWSTT
jgi:hypothetical protein